MSRAAVRALARVVRGGCGDDMRRAPRRSPDTKGSYANYFEVGHTAFEFVMDFGELYAGAGTGVCHTRVVTSPIYAVALLDVLQKSVAEYEAKFGVIDREE